MRPHTRTRSGKGRSKLRLKALRRSRDSRDRQLQLRNGRRTATALNPDERAGNKNRWYFTPEDEGRRSVNTRGDDGNIDLGIVMPGTCFALLVAVESVTRMIVRDGRNEPHAHVEHADDRGYPTPFHSVWHCYGATNQLSRKIGLQSINRLTDRELKRTFNRARRFGVPGRCGSGTLPACTDSF